MRKEIVPARHRRDPLAGIYHDPRTGQFRGRFKDAGGSKIHIGCFSTQEEAAHEYNAALAKHGLESIRKMNKVDETGRLIPKPAKAPSAIEPAESEKKSHYYGPRSVK